MKRILALLIIVGSCQSSQMYTPTQGRMPEPTPVRGDVSIIEGVTVVRVWGSHQERGYALGALIPEKVITAITGFVINNFLKNYGLDYSSVRQFYLDNINTIEEKFVDEAKGIISGMRSRDFPLYIKHLGRDLDYLDLLIGSFCSEFPYMPDAPSTEGTSNNHCSTLSSWGLSTQDEPQLNGNMVVTRNLDWPVVNYPADQNILIVHFPSEPDELKWVQASFTPGGLGTISAFNELGFAIFQTDANYFSGSEINLTDLYSIQLTQRNCVEVSDGNGDGTHDLADFIWQRDQHNYLSPTVLTCVSPDSAIALETDNYGRTQRGVSDNFTIRGDNLVATNHFRRLYEPTACYRYKNIADSLKVSTAIDIERRWNLMGGAAGVRTNIQKMEYIPALKIFKFATVGVESRPAYMREPATLNTDYLFSGTQVVTKVSSVLAEGGLLATAYVNSPTGAPVNVVEVIGYLSSTDTGVVDSVELNPDWVASIVYGTRFSNTLIHPTAEGIYTVAVRVVNQVSGYAHTAYSKPFATAGPIVIDGLVFPGDSTFLPGDTKGFWVELENLGDSATVRDVTAEIWLDEGVPAHFLGSTKRGFGDIDVGTTNQSLSVFLMNVHSECPGDTTLTVHMAIFSEGHELWRDSFEVGVNAVVGVESLPSLPATFSIQQNFPNPFNPSTTISYALPEASNIQLKVYDILGQEVVTLVCENQTAGYKFVQWNGLNATGNLVSSGVYFARIEAGTFSQTIRMVYLR